MSNDDILALVAKAKAQTEDTIESSKAKPIAYVVEAADGTKTVHTLEASSSIYVVFEDGGHSMAIMFGPNKVARS